MPRQFDLFYPYDPGFKEGTTSLEAARAIKVRANTLQAKVLAYFEKGNRSTADECARALGESILAIRPRLSELHKLKLIEATNSRHKNASGMNATVWRLK